MMWAGTHNCAPPFGLGVVLSDIPPYQTFPLQNLEEQHIPQKKIDQAHFSIIEVVVQDETIFLGRRFLYTFSDEEPSLSSCWTGTLHMNFVLGKTLQVGS